MADSIKYHRLNDPGYLIARMLINKDANFYIEGVRQLNFLFPDLGQNEMSDMIAQVFIEACVIASINNDLIAPNYQEIQVIPYGLKVQNQMVAGGAKVGFQMSSERQ